MTDTNERQLKPFFVDLEIKGKRSNNFIDSTGVFRAFDREDAINKCKRNLIKSIIDDSYDFDFIESLTGYFRVLMNYTQRDNKRNIICEYYHLDIKYYYQLSNDLQDMYKKLIVDSLTNAVTNLNSTCFHVTDLDNINEYKCSIRVN